MSSQPSLASSNDSEIPAGIHHDNHNQEFNVENTSSLRDLSSRIKILELYTLHVLPRNEEWDYARDLINMSEILGDERQEAFLHILQNLQESHQSDRVHEESLVRERDRELEQQRQDAKQPNLKHSQSPNSQQPLEPSSQPRNNPEKDYGIDPSNNPPLTKLPLLDKPHVFIPPPPLYARAVSLIRLLTSSLSKNPLSLLRLLFFILGLLVALSRRGVRERLARMATKAMEKVKGTVGMAVKVSYV